jgi:hypothetical protein
MEKKKEFSVSITLFFFFMAIYTVFIDAFDWLHTLLLFLLSVKIETSSSPITILIWHKSFTWTREINKAP